jgi:hypothetical protein
MPSPIQSAGGLTDPSAYAPLHTNRFMTGLWTNRNPLRDAATTYLYEKFYSATRFDSLIGGLNAELTPKMSLARRAGHTVYNSQIFPPINRFASFRTFSTSTEDIRVMADTAGAIYDATGPNRQVNIWNKSAGATDTTFESVGNNLFFGDGVDQKKWVQNEPPWSAGATFAPGAYIVDSNNNLQVARGGILVGVVAVQVASNVLTITLDPNDPNLPTNLMAMVGLQITLSGFTGATFLNGLTVTIGSVPQGQPAYTSNVFTLAFINANYGPTQETGTASSGSGITGGAQPAWSATIGAYTQDGGIQWVCKGPSVENWGIAPPLVAPSVVQSTLPTTFPAWSAATYFSTSFLIYDSANFIQKVTGFGNTGAVQPVFNDAPGGITNDNTVVWTCQNNGTYNSSTAVAAGAFVLQTDSTGTIYFFLAMNAGATAATPPTFTSALGSQVIDGGVTWQNVGVGAQWGDITATAIANNFGMIPLQGGGFLTLGVGQSAAAGSSIALPTGFTSAQMLAWSSPCNGFTGSGVVVEGVFQSTSAGGILNSSFQGNFGGFGVAASSNWAAAAWTAGATVTLSTVGGFSYLAFTTLMGDSMVLCAGTLAYLGTVPVPAGFIASQFQNIVGMAGADNPGHVMQGCEICNLSAGLVLTTQYTDEDANKWHGPANVFGIFWNVGGGVIQEPVTGGSALLIPVALGTSLALIQAVVENGATFGLPAGFGSAVTSATAAMSGYTPNGNSHAHGWNCTVTGFTLSAYYVDDFGTQYNGQANIFAFSAVLDQTTISSAQTIVDANGNLEAIARSGLSGAAAPAWALTEGSLTQDNSAVWRETGITTAARTQPSRWAFSWKTSVTNHVSTASPMSSNVTLDANNYAFLQGPGSPDYQVDTIVMWRIPQGGATLDYLDEIPAPPPGQLWQYIDQVPDSLLDELIPAPIAKANNPPPIGFKPLEYHLSRVFGYVGNVLSWSNGTNQIGDPNQSFQPLNFFTYPARIVRAWACTLGLIVFTVSEVYIVLGSATDADPLYTKKYIEGLGLLNYDAFTVNKTTPYLLTATKQMMALDPSAGLIEPGFPIADEFDALFDPTTAQVTWHEGAHGDTALFAGDATGNWFRMAALSAPESGLVWSTMGTIAAGFQAMSSVEVTPGQKELLLGPAVPGPILQRDTTVNTDNGVLFNWFPMIGSIVLAQPGQIAELSYFTLESVRTGTRPTMGILLGEINGPTTGQFDTLYQTRQDPPLLPPSKSLYNDRYHAMQNQQPVWCRHLQIRIDYPAEDFHNELLTYTIFGAIHTELRSQ